MMNFCLPRNILSYLLIFCFGLTSQLLQAQDEISDDDIANYVRVMAQIDTMKVEMKIKTNDLVKGNELMDKGRVFNAIKKTKGDSTELAALDITAEQLTAYEDINTQIDQMTAEFKTSYTSLIKDDLGAGVYNKIKKGLKSDDELKERYNQAIAAYITAAADEKTEG